MTFCHNWLGWIPSLMLEKNHNNPKTKNAPTENLLLAAWFGSSF
jgi:hypothetical protein